MSNQPPKTPVQLGIDDFMAQHADAIKAQRGQKRSSFVATHDLVDNSGTLIIRVERGVFRAEIVDSKNAARR